MSIIEETRNTYRILIGNLEAEKPFCKPGYR
jgi:hypothetical protein